MDHYMYDVIADPYLFIFIFITSSTDKAMVILIRNPWDK